MNIQGPDISIVDRVTYKVAVYLNVLCSFMKDWISSYVQSSLTITIQVHRFRIHHTKYAMCKATFIPSTKDSYAFINGIEIVSMPPNLYYTNPDVDSAELPQLVGTTAQYNIQNNYALERMCRLTFAGTEIPPSWDTGMLRTWDTDEKYVPTQSTSSVDYENRTKLNFTMTPNFTAPDKVYRSVRNMGTDASINMKFNITWQFPVDSGLTYVLRLHFCQLDPEVDNPGDLRFYIFIADQLATDWADILLWSDNQKGVPVVKEYAVFIQGNHTKQNLSLKLHPHPKSLILDAQINAIEMFKINDPTTGSLAGPNPDTRPQITEYQTQKKKSNSRKRIVTVIVSVVILLSFVVAFFIIKRKNNVAVDNKKHRTSRGSGSSSLPTYLCRHFSIAEIKADNK